MVRITIGKDQDKETLLVFNSRKRMERNIMASYMNPSWFVILAYSRSNIREHRKALYYDCAVLPTSRSPFRPSTRILRQSAWDPRLVQHAQSTSRVSIKCAGQGLKARLTVFLSAMISLTLKKFRAICVMFAERSDQSPRTSSSTSWPWDACLK